MRGYFEIGVINSKTSLNIGTLWRSAFQLGAAGIFTVGRRYEHQASDTPRVMRHIPLRNYQLLADLLANIPFGASLIGIEMGGQPLAAFKHPTRAIYLLGAEDNGLPQYAIGQCHQLVSIEAVRIESYNVAVAGSIVMYHRLLTT